METTFYKLGSCLECGADVEFCIDRAVNDHQGGLVFLWTCDVDRSCKQDFILVKCRAICVADEEQTDEQKQVDKRIELFKDAGWKDLLGQLGLEED